MIVPSPSDMDLEKEPRPSLWGRLDMDDPQYRFHLSWHVVRSWCIVTISHWIVNFQWQLSSDLHKCGGSYQTSNCIHNTIYTPIFDRIKVIFSKHNSQNSKILNLEREKLTLSSEDSWSAHPGLLWFLVFIFKVFKITKIRNIQPTDSWNIINYYLLNSHYYYSLVF